MDNIYNIKYLYEIKKYSIRKIAKELKIARKTVKKIIDQNFKQTQYKREETTNW